MGSIKIHNWTNNKTTKTYPVNIENPSKYGYMKVTDEGKILSNLNGLVS